MRFRNMVFVLFLAVMVVGFLATGTAQALSFDNWEGTWFKVKMSETGKAAPVVPPGGEVATNNEKTTTSYLVIDSYDISATAILNALSGYCVFNGSAWVNHVAVWPVLGGEPEHFLTLFTYSLQETQNMFHRHPGFPWK